MEGEERGVQGAWPWVEGKVGHGTQHACLRARAEVSVHVLGVGGGWGVEGGDE